MHHLGVSGGIVKHGGLSACRGHIFNQRSRQDGGTTVSRRLQSRLTSLAQRCGSERSAEYGRVNLSRCPDAHVGRCCAIRPTCSSRLGRRGAGPTATRQWRVLPRRCFAARAARTRHSPNSCGRHKRTSPTRCGKSARAGCTATKRGVELRSTAPAVRSSPTSIMAK